MLNSHGRSYQQGKAQMRRHNLFAAGVVLILSGVVACSAPPPAATGGHARRESADGLDRTVLPIPEPDYPAVTELDARNATAPPRFEVKAPKGAPNVVIVLLDDIGLRPFVSLRRPHQHADAAGPGGRWPPLQPVPHHRALLADQDGAPDRPQSSRQQRRRHHGAGDGISGQHGCPAPERRACWPTSCA